MYERIVPVSIVQLDLDELNLRVLVEDLFEQSGCAVVRKSEVLDLAFFPLLNTPIETIVLLVCIVVVAVFNAVEKVEIEIVHTASVELFFEDLIPVFKRMYAPRRKLCCECERISRMALYDSFLYCLFGVAAVINIRGIEISESGIEIRVYHFADFVEINDSVSFRQPHKTKTDLRHLAYINAHSSTS